MYSFVNEQSRSALTFVINRPPSNGSCSIFPTSGTTMTRFTVTCPDWSDEDGIQDYSLYRSCAHFLSTKIFSFLRNLVESTDRTFIGFSSVSTFDVRLPSGPSPSYSLQLFVSIRDKRDCVAEWNLKPVVVQPDWTYLNDLMNSSSASIAQILFPANQNTLCQIISSISQQMNENPIISAEIPSALISVGSLWDSTSNVVNGVTLLKIPR